MVMSTALKIITDQENKNLVPGKDKINMPIARLTNRKICYLKKVKRKTPL